MSLIGVLWAAFAPLSLVLAILVIALGIRLVHRRPGARWRALGIAALLVVAPTALLWWTDRVAFRRLCEAMGPGVIRRTAAADGFFLDSGAANSFGMRYLHDEGFRWIEAADYRRRDGFVRYSRADDGTIVTDSIGQVTARYRVVDSDTAPLPYASFAITRVIDGATGEELARASNGHFSGGRAKWVLGAWGVASCPSAFSNSDGFNTYYHLAKLTLR